MLRGLYWLYWVVAGWALAASIVGTVCVSKGGFGYHGEWAAVAVV